MICQAEKYTGMDVVLDYYIGCGDTLPAPDDWVRLGAMRTKEFNPEWETADATADDTVGKQRDNVATFLGITISGDGTLKASGPGSEGQKALMRHYLNPIATSGQPKVWMRMTYPDLTFINYMLVTTFNRSSPFDDVATFSLEAGGTASAFGLIVEDTPPTEEPVSLSIAPATATLEIGETVSASATVLPSGASQAVVWQSASTGVATVNSAGVVTGVGVGTTQITARSAVDGAISGTMAVTVTV